MSQSEIGRIEAGNSNPTLSTIAALEGAPDAEFSLLPRKTHKTVSKR